MAPMYAQIHHLQVNELGPIENGSKVFLSFPLLKTLNVLPGNLWLFVWVILFLVDAPL